MQKRIVLNKDTITSGDIKRRHPRYLTCETDKVYAHLANEIRELLRDELSFMEPVQARNACISLALYFEDIHSGLHLFETFIRLYKKMFGYYLPFYSTTGEDDPNAELDAMCFMFWHSCVAEREGQVLNPQNEGLRSIAGKLLDFWHEHRDMIPPNEELADYLYSEETQTEAGSVKTVLVWLSRYSPLGRWFTNVMDVDRMPEIKRLMQSADKDMMAYAADCYSLCENRTWPLSLAPQRIYAEMIRIEMDDSEDELAAEIEGIELKSLSLYEIDGCDSEFVSLKDFLGNVIRVNLREFTGDVGRLARQNTHLFASFMRMNGVWQLNGPCVWIKPSPKQVEKDLEKLRQNHRVMTDFKGQYDWFIDKHDGERLYFFANSQEQAQWVKEELGLNFENAPLDDEHLKRPLAVFFEDNGHMTTCFQAHSINHINNNYYNPSESSKDALGFVISRGYCSPGLLLYLMKNDLLRDAGFNDIRGSEYGCRLVQENMEFIARCLRRDIPTDEVCRQSTVLDPGAGEEGLKKTFESFISLIAREKSIRSKANKEWLVVKVNRETTVIRDVSNRQNYEMHTRALYEAHLELNSNEIQVAALAPFVGKKNAPAASALLYNIVGEGQSMNICANS